MKQANLKDLFSKKPQKTPKENEILINNLPKSQNLQKEQDTPILPLIINSQQQGSSTIDEEVYLLYITN